MASSPVRAALVDVDGTLVDSNYLHLLAWSRALRDAGEWVPMHVIHGCIGMGADQLLPQLIGREDEAIADGHSRHFRTMLADVVPFPAADALLRRLVSDGVTVVLATSSSNSELDAMLGLLGVEDLDLARVTGDDIARSKPDPAIVHAALAKAGVEPALALLIGDSEWDARAAAAAAVPCVLVQPSAPTSGATRSAVEAVPLGVFEDLQQLLGHVERHGLGHWS